MNKLSIKYISGLPVNYENFLVERYKSFITTCRYIETYYPSEKFYHALLKENDLLLDIFIVVVKDNVCYCHNSLVSIPQDVLSEFINSIFVQFLKVNKVRYSASYIPYELDKSILINNSNDYVLQLPETLNDYFASLGNTTRRHLKNYKSRLSRDFPEFEFVINRGQDIDKEVIRKIIQLSYKRMRTKGITPGKDEKDVDDFYNYSKFYGQVCYIQIDGKIIAGSISYCIDNRFFLFMIAHDNDYAKYNPGQLCILFSIEKAIDMEMKTFHFLWGDNIYKQKLGGEQQKMWTYEFYKSYSFSFFVNKMKAFLYRKLITLKHSNFAKPLRDTVKNFRKKT